MMNERTIDLPQAQQIDYKWVPIGECFRPFGAQRPFNPKHAADIAAKFNETAFGTPILSYREHGNRDARGRAYAIIAGQHRIAAAELVGRTRVFCAVVYGLDAAGEARLFVDEDHRKNQNTLQKFHIARSSQDPETLAVWETVIRCGFTIPIWKSSHLPDGSLICVSALAAAHRRGVLSDVLNTLADAFDRKYSAARAEIVSGLTVLFAYRSAQIDRKRLARKLREAGTRTLLQRRATASESFNGATGLTMANVMIGVYNMHLRNGGELDMIQHSETRRGGNSPEFLAKRTGKTLAEARAEVAARRAAGEAV